MLLSLLTSCTVKTKELPSLKAPYINRISFLKRVYQQNGKLLKIPYENRVRNPFYIYIEIENTSGEGNLKIVFYKNNEIVYGKEFSFGENGKDYEKITIWSRVEKKLTGKIRYAVFYNNSLLWTGKIIIFN